MHESLQWHAAALGVRLLAAAAALVPGQPGAVVHIKRYFMCICSSYLHPPNEDQMHLQTNLLLGTQTVSIVFFTETWRPDSFYHKIVANQRLGLHTLCLLDIQVKEPDLAALARGRQVRWRACVVHFVKFYAWQSAQVMPLQGCM